MKTLSDGLIETIRAVLNTLPNQEISYNGQRVMTYDVVANLEKELQQQPTTMEEFLNNIDFTLLKSQKKELVEAGNIGLVHLIDDIQDIAVDEYGYGEHVVFSLDSSNPEVHIIAVISEGLGSEVPPKAFSNEDLAGQYYETLIGEKGFRAKEEGETWKEYVDAFQAWEDTEDVTYDVMDWEVSWFEGITVNADMEYLNHYLCVDCKHTWDEKLKAKSSQECSQCGATVEPHISEVV